MVQVSNTRRVGTQIEAFTPIIATGDPTMTSLNNIAQSATAQSRSAPDFVSTDIAALASHMSHCANSRSRFFGFRAVLESAHSLVLPRMVTAALLTVVAMGAVGMI